MKKIAIRTAKWTNSLGIETSGAYQFDNVNDEFIFRIVGSNGLTVPALSVIGKDSFRWNEPQFIEVNN
jgi:hypothetical protein